MNFIPCHLAEQDGVIGVSLQSESDIQFLAVKQSAELKNRVGQKILLGIRPEQLDVAGSDAHGLGCLVQLTEPTGPDTMIFTEINHSPVVARVHPRAVKRPGETLRLSLDMSKAVIFDSESGLRIE